MQTCISCGLVVAREQLLSGGPYYRPESTGHIILLTDGTQTIDDFGRLVMLQMRIHCSIA